MCLSKEVIAPAGDILYVLRWQAGDSEQELLLPPFVAYDFEDSLVIARVSSRHSRNWKGIPPLIWARHETHFARCKASGRLLHRPSHGSTWEVNTQDSTHGSFELQASIYFKSLLSHPSLAYSRHSTFTQRQMCLTKLELLLYFDLWGKVEWLSWKTFGACNCQSSLTFLACIGCWIFLDVDWSMMEYGSLGLIDSEPLFIKCNLWRTVDPKHFKHPC